MPSSSLYESTVTDHMAATRSFKIDRLFYVALLGGFTAMAALGLTNAAHLKYPRRRLFLLAAGTLFLFVGKAILLQYALDDINHVPAKYQFPILKITDFILFLFFYFNLRERYIIHKMYVSRMTPLYSLPTFGWCALSLVVEAAYLLILGN